MEEIEELRNAIREGEPELAEELAKGIVSAGADALGAIRNAAVPGINDAGDLWKKNVYFVPDVVMSAEAFKSAMTILESNMPSGKRESIGKYLICSVQGDIHSLGKSIVVPMLKGAGFEVHDLGEDVPIDVFLDKVKEVEPDIVGLGAYMSTTAATLQNYVKALEEAGLRDKLKVMIGGVRTSEQYATGIGADSWGRDGPDAAAKAKELMGVDP
ncbi:MAG: cobalamin B12-binding domain-containing protein [Candidatus Thorarchaeota archaeon]|jgi:methanogenic corrinoid protein MtbC1